MKTRRIKLLLLTALFLFVIVPMSACVPSPSVEPVVTPFADIETFTPTADLGPAVDALPAEASPADPREGLFEYAIISQRLTEVNTVMQRFFGDGSTKLSPLEQDSGIVAYASKDGSISITWDETRGYFDLDNPSDIPRYYDEGDSWGDYNPKANDVPGKFTPDEAAELGLAFQKDMLGMDTSNLTIKTVEGKEPGKERSRMYRIEYEYKIDGRELLSIPGSFGIEMWVSDKGVEAANGSAVHFEKKVSIPSGELMTQQQIIDMLKQNKRYHNGDVYSLVYQPRKQDDGSYHVAPSWYKEAQQDNIIAYDARTGERIDSEW